MIKTAGEHGKWNIIKKPKSLSMKETQSKSVLEFFLPQQQRDRDRKLINEMKDRRDNGMTGLYIENGQLQKAGEVSHRR